MAQILASISGGIGLLMTGHAIYEVVKAQLYGTELQRYIKTIEEFNFSENKNSDLVNKRHICLEVDDTKKKVTKMKRALEKIQEDLAKSKNIGCRSFFGFKFHTIELGLCDFINRMTSHEKTNTIATETKI